MDARISTTTPASQRRKSSKSLSSKASQGLRRHFEGSLKTTDAGREKYPDITRPSSLARLRSASTSLATSTEDGDEHDELLGRARSSTTTAVFPIYSRMAAHAVGPRYDPRDLPPEDAMNSVNIAVIGSAGVGKSTLIQRALGLRAPPTAVASILKMIIDNVRRVVSLVELDLESFDINPEKPIQWPKQINGQIVPRMDGAFILYDVMNRDSVVELPQILNALANSNTPAILVACKCDNPANTRQIDTDNMEATCNNCVKAVKTASNVPEGALFALSAMLREVLARRNGENTDPTSTKPRRNSASHIQILADTPEEPPTSPTRRRLSRSHNSAGGNSAGMTSSGSDNLPQHARNHPQESLAESASNPVFVSSSNMISTDQLSLGPAPSINDSLAMSETFTEDQSDADSTYRYSDDVPILQRNDDSFSGKPVRATGSSFDELVDRLLSQHMCKADTNFSDIFLCLYRKFAAPSELLSAILIRFKFIMEDEHAHYLTQMAAQLRVITVIVRWLSSYPGDFASPQTSQRLESLINQLALEPVFAAAAQEMRTQLALHVVEDDDTGWARTDADAFGPNAKPNPATQSTQERLLSEYELSGTSSRNISMEEEAQSQRRRPSMAPSTSSTGAGSILQSAVDMSYNSVEDYEREAATLVPTSTLPLTKFRYHIFMDIPDDDFADEMTRIDWVMFSSIRVRDLVRHVSLKLEQKNKCRSLVNVNRMIDHFNHIAKWVSNMVLMRDKPKHRAQMLEKFIRIAAKLRQLNNYNGLAAVIAGINGSAIHRLRQTHELVATDVMRQFQKLQLLMSTQKSHFAYRLAWENSPLPRIPFIPLHRRDLVSAEEGSRTFVGPNGDRINWKKFEVLAEVVLPIMKSQMTPYVNLVRRDIAKELILDCRMPTDDEEIYTRSLEVESSASSTLNFGKKKFPWFQN